MTTKEIAKTQLIFAIPCAIVYAFAKVILFTTAYTFFTTDFGIDIHMDAFKAFAIVYAISMALFSIWRGV